MAKSADIQQLLNGPAMTPPLGEKSNFVDPSNMKAGYIIDVVVCLAVSTIVVCMRLWTKSRLIRQVTLEDCEFPLRFATYSTAS
jgi:hypothetical protein